MNTMIVNVRVTVCEVSTWLWESKLLLVRGSGSEWLLVRGSGSEWRCELGEWMSVIVSVSELVWVGAGVIVSDRQLNWVSD